MIANTSAAAGCILSKFYIKPQLLHGVKPRRPVVSYRNSTSNHNCSHNQSSALPVVSYRNSTSNHNFSRKRGCLRRLYLIEILHQTTTSFKHAFFQELLYLIEILHQTTTPVPIILRCLCCILSKFYIKPQQLNWEKEVPVRCILSKFYIKPQLQRKKANCYRCCILSKFYIKPQRRASY